MQQPNCDHAIAGRRVPHGQREWPLRAVIVRENAPIWVNCEELRGTGPQVGEGCPLANTKAGVTQSLGHRLVGRTVADAHDHKLLAAHATGSVERQNERLVQTTALPHAERLLVHCQIQT